MNYFGVYHADYSRSNGGICDAPSISKGRMMLCAKDIASEGSLIAMAEGRMRNREQLAGELNCPAATSAARVVLRAYQKWGDDYPSHVEGPVTTCVMDAEADRMVISRDRMGEKMIFYTWRGDSAAFADHPDSLLKTASAESIMDVDGMREMFGLGPARTPGRTFLRDIQAIEPGCALILKGDCLKIDRYYRIEDHPHVESEGITIEHTRALLEQAIDDVIGLQPAVMLSGGLDSTALTALIAARNGRIQSFSVDYQDNAVDFVPNAFRPEMDGPFIEMAVRAFHTQHRTIVLDQQSLARALGRAVSLRGFPGMADIDSSLLLFAGQIARYAQNVVSGECGDEVFGGYPWFRGEAPLMDGVFPWSGSLELRESLLIPEVREKLKLQEYVRDIFSDHLNAAQPKHDCSPKERRLKIMQKLCFEFFMTNLQERAVRMCEGAGVRVLTPLCDERLVEYVYNVPWDMKFMEGQEKGLFRAAVRDLLPERLLRRKKSPYPKTCSPVYTEMIRKMTMNMVSDAGAPIFEWVDRDRVRAIAQSDLNPVETPWYGQLMAGPQMLGYLWQINRWLVERNVTVLL